MYTPGWLNRPDAVEAGLNELRLMGDAVAFDQTPAFADPQTDTPDDIFGWKYVTDLAGWVDENQGSIGSCVAFGTNMAVEAVEGAEIRVKGDLETFTRYAREVTYGGSRVEIGGGKLNGDGSVGIWAAKFVTQYGMVPLGKYGNYDLSTYNIQTCRAFGNSGVPTELETVSRQFPVASHTQVKTSEEAWKAIGNLNFIAICSDVGFEGPRDEDGVCRPQGNWSHCMAVIGRAIIKGKRHFYIQNSWGVYNRGPIGYGQHPAGGFWVTEDTLGRILSQGDSWAFSGAKGFPAKKINWKDM